MNLGMEMFPQLTLMTGPLGEAVEKCKSCIFFGLKVHRNFLKIGGHFFRDG